MEEMLNTNVMEEVTETVVEETVRKVNFRNGIAVGLTVVALGLIGKHIYDKVKTAKNNNDEDEEIVVEAEIQNEE